MTDEQIQQLLNQNAELLKENARLREENRLLNQKVDLLVRRVYGHKSEQRHPDQLDLLLDELNNGPQAPSASPLTVLEEAAPAARRKRKERKPRYPEDLPVVEEVINPPAVEADPSAWRKIGEEVSEQLDYSPGQFQRRRTIRGTWVKRDNPDIAPLTAPLPPKLLERGMLAPGLLAHIAVSKYTDHLPLYRQEQIFKQRHGVHLPRQTMARGIELIADWLQPVVRAMKDELFETGYVQVDETPVQYQEPGRGKTAQGYMWVANRPGANTVFHWACGRGTKHLKEIMPTDFRGVVQCDGYSAYKALARENEAVHLAGCMAHMRRKFFEARELGEAPVRVAWILHQIGLLYRLESEHRESRAGPALREAVRCSQSRPILRRLKRLFTQLETRRIYRPKTAMGKAISYALNQWSTLEVYLSDGRIEIDNNLVENAIRPTALGRKNWLFIGRDEAGWRSAVIYSVILSCKNHEVEPYAYLKDVLERLPGMTNHQVPGITPRNWAAARKEQPLRLAS
ncbi:MAG: IS66 family transposase [Gammaproteobacteria bacterium]|nr:IS66 family transposase [Gammaproteobacteria bacterium]